MMKDKIEICLKDISNSTKDKIKKNDFQIGGNYSILKEVEKWDFDYEVNKVRFDTLNKNKLYFIKDWNEDICSDSN